MRLARRTLLAFCWKTTSPSAFSVRPFALATTGFAVFAVALVLHHLECDKKNTSPSIETAPVFRVPFRCPDWDSCLVSWQIYVPAFPLEIMATSFTPFDLTHPFVGISSLATGSATLRVIRSAVLGARRWVLAFCLSATPPAFDMPSRALVVLDWMSFALASHFTL